MQPPCDEAATKQRHEKDQHPTTHDTREKDQHLKSRKGKNIKAKRRGRRSGFLLMLRFAAHCALPVSPCPYPLGPDGKGADALKGQPRTCCVWLRPLYRQRLPHPLDDHRDSFEEIRWDDYCLGNFPENMLLRTSFTQSPPMFLCPSEDQHPTASDARKERAKEKRRINEARNRRGQCKEWIWSEARGWTDPG